MINPGSKEGEYETMSSKSGGKSVHDRETPSTMKGEEEGTARQCTGCGNKDSTSGKHGSTHGSRPFR